MNPKTNTTNVIAFETRIIQDGGAVSVDVLDGDLKLLLIAPPREASEPFAKPVIKHNFVDGVFQFSFENFTEPQGAITNAPSHFASQGTKRLYYLAIVYKFIGYMKVELQISLEVAA